MELLSQLSLSFAAVDVCSTPSRLNPLPKITLSIWHMLSEKFSKIVQRPDSRPEKQVVVMNSWQRIPVFDVEDQKES